MGRRRKRRKKKVRRGLRLPPRFFQCPVCGSLTLTIDFKKSDEPGKKIAIARCGTCGLYCVFKVHQNMERIDVYNMLSDLVYENRLDECRPTEAEAVEAEEAEPLEEETAEEGESVGESTELPP